MFDMLDRLIDKIWSIILKVLRFILSPVLFLFTMDSYDKKCFRGRIEVDEDIDEDFRELLRGYK